MRKLNSMCAFFSSRICVNARLQGGRGRSSGSAAVRILGRPACGGDGAAFGSSGDGDHGSPRVELRLGGPCGRNGRRAGAGKADKTRQEEEEEHQKEKTRGTGSVPEFVGRQGQGAISERRRFIRVNGASHSAYSLLLVVFVSIEETDKEIVEKGE